jgi:hypothetical protein
VAVATLVACGHKEDPSTAQPAPVPASADGSTPAKATIKPDGTYMEPEQRDQVAKEQAGK